MGTMFSNIFSDVNTGLGENIYRELRTTDDTADDIVTISVPEEQTVVITAKINGRGADDTLRASFYLSALFYRNTGGDVTLDGNVQVLDSHVSDGCGYTADIVADTTAQTIVVRVAGTDDTVDPDYVYWSAQVNYIRR